MKYAGDRREPERLAVALLRNHHLYFNVSMNAELEI